MHSRQRKGLERLAARPRARHCKLFSNHTLTCVDCTRVSTVHARTRLHMDHTWDNFQLETPTFSLCWHRGVDLWTLDESDTRTAARRPVRCPARCPARCVATPGRRSEWFKLTGLPAGSTGPSARVLPPSPGYTLPPDSMLKLSISRKIEAT